MKCFFKKLEINKIQIKFIQALICRFLYMYMFYELDSLIFEAEL